MFGWDRLGLYPWWWKFEERAHQINQGSLDRPGLFWEQFERNKYMYKCQNKVIFFNGKSDITLEINGENIITVFIQKSIAILELKEKKFVYFYHTTEESNKQG